MVVRDHRSQITSTLSGKDPSLRSGWIETATCPTAERLSLRAAETGTIQASLGRGQWVTSQTREASSRSKGRNQFKGLLVACINGSPPRSQSVSLELITGRSLRG